MLEYMRLVEVYKQSQGQKAKIPTQVLIDAEKGYLEAVKALETAKQEGSDDSVIAPLVSAMYQREAEFEQVKAKSQP